MNIEQNTTKNTNHTNDPVDISEGFRLVLPRG